MTKSIVKTANPNPWNIAVRCRWDATWHSTPRAKHARDTWWAADRGRSSFRWPYPSGAANRAADRLKRPRRAWNCDKHAPVRGVFTPPLMFDMDTKRMLRPATWRTLTVAENRAIQPADVAVGYRVQTGKEQWLFYRSLAERGNRTLLGQNLSSEFLAARFNRNGETDPLLEIE